MIKKSQKKAEIDKNFFNSIKIIYKTREQQQQQTTNGNIILNEETLNISSQIESKARLSILPPYSIMLEGITSAI